jgi:hypothetical protein
MVGLVGKTKTIVKRHFRKTSLNKSVMNIWYTDNIYTDFKTVWIFFPLLY